MIEKWNSGTQDYPDRSCLHGMFRESAKKNRDAIAIVYKVWWILSSFGEGLGSCRAGVREWSIACTRSRGRDRGNVDGRRGEGVPAMGGRDHTTSWRCTRASSSSSFLPLRTVFFMKEALHQSLTRSQPAEVFFSFSPAILFFTARVCSGGTIGFGGVSRNVGFICIMHSRSFGLEMVYFPKSRYCGECRAVPAFFLAVALAASSPSHACMKSESVPCPSSRFGRVHPLRLGRWMT